jgi:hypothetical protein
MGIMLQAFRAIMIVLKLITLRRAIQISKKKENLKKSGSWWISSAGIHSEKN